MTDTFPTSPASPAVNPRHLGLPRRQSYDPLTTSSSLSSSSSKPGPALSLGALPGPSFTTLPLGQRSVPAVEASRILGHSSTFRSISGPLGDGQRTPGGSLVVGAEIFGFGSRSAHANKDRWADVSASTSKPASVGGGDTPRSSALQFGSDDGRAPAWPDEIEQRVANSKRLSGATDASPRSRTSRLDSSNDYVPSGLPRPMLRSTGSSAELRSTSPFASADDEPVRIPSRPNNQRAATGLPLTAAIDTKVPNVASPLSASELRSTDRIAFSTSTNPPTPSYSNYESPAAAGYFGQTVGSSALGAKAPSATNFDAFAPGPTSISPDELAFNLKSLSVGSDANEPQPQRRRSDGVSPSVPSAGYSANGGRDGIAPPSRQSSGGFPPFFVSPYLTEQDPYAQAGFADPSAFFHGQQHHAGAVAGLAGEQRGLRRDSGYAPSYQSTPSSNNSHTHSPYSMDAFRAPPMQQHAAQAWPVPHGADYAPSGHASRQGSFSSYTPSMPYGMPPSSSALAGAGPPPPFDAAAAAAVTGAPGFQPGHGLQHQLGQQHQIILGRGLRSSADYIAPGPLAAGPYVYPAAGYGHGYGAAETMGRALRSATLEEFRTSRHRIWELTDILGHVVEFSGDQLGSRFIQSKLETASAEEKAKVFEEVLPNMLQLSTDVFANYVIQKFFEQGNQLQKTAMANVLEGHVLQLSLQMYGCRVVQKALEYVLVDQQVKLIRELDGHVLKCARDAQSNHVIQRALERVPSDKLTFITDAVVGQVHNLATHPYGCRVLQRIFENCPTSQTRTLLDELHRSIQVLIQDQYGNYVVQWVIEKGESPDRSRVISNVIGHVLPLSQQKFASNAIEKCVVHATDAERARIVDEVLAPAPDGSSVVRAMLVHPYANYVVQKVLNTAVGPQRDALFDEVSVQLNHIRKFSSSYSKHLIAIEKLLANERAAKGLPY